MPYSPNLPTDPPDRSAADSSAVPMDLDSPRDSAVLPSAPNLSGPCSNDIAPTSSSYVPQGSAPNIVAGDFDVVSSPDEDCYYCGVDSQSCLYFCSDVSTIDSPWQWDWSYQYLRHSVYSRSNSPSSILDVRPDFFGHVCFTISPLYPCITETSDDCMGDSDLFRGLDLSRLHPQVYLQSKPAINSIRKEIWGLIT